MWESRLNSRLSYAKPEANSTAMGFKLFDPGKLHDCWANILQTFPSEVGTSNMFDVRSQIHARVLLCVSVCCCPRQLVSRTNKEAFGEGRLTEGVIDTSRVIANALWGPLTNEDTASIFD